MKKRTEIIVYIVLAAALLSAPAIFFIGKRNGRKPALESEACPHPEPLEKDGLEAAAEYWRELSAFVLERDAVDDVTSNDLDMDAVFEGMRFPYTLLDGPSDTKNAISLLASLRFPEEVIDRANGSVERFLKTNNWVE